MHNWTSVIVLLNASKYRMPVVNGDDASSNTSFLGESNITLPTDENDIKIILCDTLGVTHTWVLGPIDHATSCDFFLKQLIAQLREYSRLNSVFT